MFLGIVYLIASVNLLALIPTVGLLIALYFMRRYYMPAARNLKRLEAAGKYFSRETHHCLQPHHERKLEMFFFCL